MKQYALPGALACVFLFVFACADNQSVEKKLQQINQDPRAYVKKNSLPISKPQQEQFKQDFLNHYFSAWDGQGTESSTAEVLQEVQKEFKDYLTNPGWSPGEKRIPKQFFEHVYQQANLPTYPNTNRPGIIVHGAHVRVLPTLLPSFGDAQKAGQGYPFDNLEQSYIERGTPVQVLHRTKDYLWYLINTASYHGWVPSQSLGFVSSDFIAQWKQGPFLVPSRDHIPVFADNHFVLATTRLGILYPLVGETAEDYRLLLPWMDGQGNAQLQTFSISKANSHRFPMDISAQNIAAIAQTMMNTPYGWGGLYQQRDCSATTSDLLASVGLWLPRNSLQQSKKGDVISLVGMTSQQKIDTIKQQATPFFTLLYAPGHIALYLGTVGQEVYVLQDVWGLHTFNVLAQEGRAVIGRTVITPIDLGEHFMNVKETFLDRLRSMSVLLPRTKLSTFSWGV